MNRTGWLVRLILLVGLIIGWTEALARAQSSCSHVTIRLDSAQALDSDAICLAARPWADKGFRIFIYLTDIRPQNEDAWFTLLDQVEADAGLRDLSQPDSFDKNVLAFETSTATDLPWASSITYGESLYDTPLDSDAAVMRIKSQLREALASGDATQAFAQTVNTAYETNFPRSTSQTEQLDAPTKAEPPPTTKTEERASNPWGWALVGVLGVGVLGAGGYGLTVKVINPARQRARYRAELEHHMETLRARTANLLNAGDQLLQGDTPQETVLYELFSAYGGEHYPERRDQLLEWLDRCQGALDDAFDLRQKLLDPGVQEQRTLEQAVQNWELLYVTLVGNSERILALTNDELRTLLDPLLTFERSAPDTQLPSQLDDLRRELAGGIKVDLRMVDPAQTDAAGILGYIEQIKAQIAHLLTARKEAPERLRDAKAQRLAAQENVPQSFVMTGEQLFAGVDQNLARAEADLEKGVFLHVIERADEVVRDLATAQHFITTLSNHEQRQTKIDAITHKGYHPDSLEDDLQEIENDLRTIIHQVKAGDYVAAASWIEEMEIDSQRTLSNAQTWRALHEQNTAALRQFDKALARVEVYQANEVATTLKELESYPGGNWSDVKAGLTQAQQTLQLFRQEWISRIAGLNNMAQQRFTQAEQMLAQASADLAQAERQLQAVVRRLAEVQTAETHIPEALRSTAADLDQAARLRDQEDPKIGPEVDQQLQQARAQLAEAQRLAAAREFISATNAQTAARELATQAYAAASEQVQEINELQMMLAALTDSVSTQVDHCNAAAQALPAIVQTDQTHQLIRQVGTAFSQAQQARAASTGLQDHALSEALRATVAAYQEADQLAARALEQVTADRTTYDRALTEARNAIHAAQAAVQQASWAVREPDAQSSGSRALERARKTLAQIGPTDGATREALGRLRQKAQQVQQDAQQAESHARQTIQATQAERRRQRERLNRSRSFGSPGGSSSSRSSSRRSVSRSSGSSRRSSSFGSSRRSSSRGTSRRR
jgi:hypothetical protein